MIVVKNILTIIQFKNLKMKLLLAINDESTDKILKALNVSMVMDYYILIQLILFKKCHVI